MSIQLEARNADLREVVEILQQQRARRLDLVVPASLVHALAGQVVITDEERTRLISEDGVTSAGGSYRLTGVAQEGLGAKLGIPSAYLKKLAAERTDLWDMNVNGMLHGGELPVSPGLDPLGNELSTLVPGYPGNLLLRLLKSDEKDDGILRAVLSPRYKFIDNLDVLLAVMDGIRKAGVNAVPGFVDLSEKKMIAKFDVPEIAVLAPELLKGYRTPFRDGGAERAGEDRPGYRLRSEYGNWTPEAALRAAEREGQGYKPGEEPIVWAGLRVSNSDVGGGGRTIVPEIKIQACKNGLCLIGEADRKVHLGSTQDEGVVAWSSETQERELALITAQTVDAVTQFLNPDWFKGQVARLEELAGVPVREADQVRAVATAVGYTKAETEGILAHFYMGGQLTAAGVANAVTSYSQTVASADRADELDRSAVKALQVAAKAGG